MIKIRIYFCTIILLFALITVSGCLASLDTRTNITGKQISKDIKYNVEIGRTTRADIVAKFGPPTSSTKGYNDYESLRYNYSKTTKTESFFLFIWKGEDTTTESDNVVFNLRNDILESYSRE
ncbi:MAG: hypothetical protein JEZ07_04830 [Phycisphaerae bacterium]|nr:hypothetical protein [Phycisphaerae bacterium]